MSPTWRRSLYAAWLAQFVAVLGFGAVNPFLPLFLKDVGVDEATNIEIWAGVLAAATPATMAFASPIWGALADRYGPKSMVMRAMFAGSLTVATMAFATSPWHLLVLRLLQGAFTGTVSASAMLATSISPRDRIGWSLGLMQMAVYLGAAIGPLVGGTLSDAIGYRTVFGLTGAVFVAAGVIVFLLVEYVPPVRKPQQAGTSSRGTGIMAGLRIVRHDQWLLAVSFLLFSVQMTRGAVFPVLPLFIEDLLNTGVGAASQAGLILAAAGIASALTSFLSGRLSERIGFRGTLVGCALLVAVFELPQFFVVDTWQLLLFRTGTGLFVGFIIPAANAVVGYVAPPERRGVVFGVTSAATSAGMAVGPLIGAGAAAGFGLSSVFIVTAAVMIVTGFWVFTVTRKAAGSLRKSMGSS